MSVISNNARIRNGTKFTRREWDSKDQMEDRITCHVQMGSN